MKAQRAREDKAVTEALELIDAVRRWDRRDVQHLLDVIDLPAAAVALAAMVDEDKTPQALLGWVHEQHHDAESVVCDGWTWEEMRRSHSQYELCRSRGIAPPDDVREGQRAYDRIRKRISTQKVAAA